MHQPIKRHKSLQPLSRDHHQGLLLCWKIKEGLKRNIPTYRIKLYVEWFWQNHLFDHFQFEEKHIFTLLPETNPLIIQAITEHRRLQLLCEQTMHLPSDLIQIKVELENHIRFEERVLFNEIQQTADPFKLDKLAELHHGAASCESWEDAFWI